MKFSDIIKSHSWLSVEIVMLQLYPDEKKNLSGYEKVFNDLRSLTPIVSDITIQVIHTKDDFDDLEYVDVSGYKNDPGESSDDLSDSLALEFTPWEEWLGMDIDQQSLVDFTELELICHCLFEMTFLGFEPKEIQDELEKLNNVVDEIKNMTEEDRKQKLIPMDEVLKRMENRDQGKN